MQGDYIQAARWLRPSTDVVLVAARAIRFHGVACDWQRQRAFHNAACGAFHGRRETHLVRVITERCSSC